MKKLYTLAVMMMIALAVNAGEKTFDLLWDADNAPDSSVPLGWICGDVDADGNGVNIGTADHPNAGGSRGFAFASAENFPHKFGLYMRSGKAEESGYSAYGCDDLGNNASHKLDLKPGTYKLTFCILNWNNSSDPFAGTSVKVKIYSEGSPLFIDPETDEEITTSFTCPEPNIGNGNKGYNGVAPTQEYSFTLTDDMTDDTGVVPNVGIIFRDCGGWAGTIIPIATLSTDDGDITSSAVGTDEEPGDDPAAIATVNAAAQQAAAPVKAVRNGQIIIGGYNALGQRVY